MTAKFKFGQKISYFTKEYSIVTSGFFINNTIAVPQFPHKALLMNGKA